MFQYFIMQGEKQRWVNEHIQEMKCLGQWSIIHISGDY